MIKVTWVSSAADISDALWDVCFQAPFEGQWWYVALEQAKLEDQFTFLYGIVYEHEKPVAIAPAFVMNVPIRLVMPPAILPIVNVLGKIMPWLLYQRTFFIGSPCSDEGRVGMVNQENVLERLGAINHAMQAQADAMQAPMRVWKDFSNQHKTALTRLLKPEGLFQLVSFPGTEAKLTGTSKSDFMASLKGEYRSNLKRKLKQTQNAKLSTSIVQQPDTFEMDELFALFWQTYEKGDTKFERLNRKFFDLISSHKHVFYVILREPTTQKIVAFMLCFKLGSHVINKFIGIDYARPKEWFLYFALWEAAVEWAYSVGANAIQSGQTGYIAKIRLGHDMVNLTNYCKHKNPLVHFIFATVAKTVNWQTLDEGLALYVKTHPEIKSE
ncbi:MAG: peptidogalycan biosysnthesis protein [Methylophilaceae bacterium]